MPGGLDQQPASVLVSGQGDVPAMLLITGGVLGRGDPKPGRELPRVPEPREVADLGDQPERGDRRDPSEPGQDLHLSAPPLAAGDLGQPRIEGVELTLDPVDVDQQLLKCLLSERIIEPLGSRASDGAASSTPSSPPGRSCRAAAAA